MNDRTKEIIIKILLILVVVLETFAILIPVFSGFFVGEQAESVNERDIPLPQPFYTIWIVDLVFTLCFGVAFMILLPIFGLKQKPVKAEKFAVSFHDYHSLEQHIHDSAQSNGYTQQPRLTFRSDGTLVTYIKPNGLWQENCIALLRVAELTDDNLDCANDAITESLKAYHRKAQITNAVDMIMIVCVNRITPTFQKLVRSNIQQGIKNGRLCVGISFGGKTIYIARQKDGFAIAKYKKLRKEFLKIMQIQDGGKS